jgi:hypothetical protein
MYANGLLWYASMAGAACMEWTPSRRVDVASKGQLEN